MVCRLLILRFDVFRKGKLEGKIFIAFEFVPERDSHGPGGMVPQPNMVHPGHVVPVGHIHSPQQQMVIVPQYSPHHSPHPGVQHYDHHPHMQPYPAGSPGPQMGMPVAPGVPGSPRPTHQPHNQPLGPAQPQTFANPITAAPMMGKPPSRTDKYPV